MSEGPAVSLTGIPEVSELDDYFQALVAQIQELPVRPVIFCARPFAILAVLIPYVAGFVFESASTLCHLAILVREHGLPAVEAAAPFLQAEPGGFVTLDTHAPAAVALERTARAQEAS
jgi:phosphoenolpyruvate-protein kinase (PTS system EI component)